MKKLKILILIRRFDIKYPKHKHLFDSIAALEEFAEVQYWHEDGNIHEILKKIKIEPDFIFMYDTTWGHGLTPEIKGLGKIKIPKGCYVIDVHHKVENRRSYIENNKIDLIFSPSKRFFLKHHSEYKDKLRWIPFAINPDIIKDWKLEKDINFLLMGLVYYDDPKKTAKKIGIKGRYEFREAVYNKLKDNPDFVFVPHPGHRVSASEDAYINEKYGKMLNRSKIFFTCSGKSDIAIAKYFEVLGCKSLLLAPTSNELLELGFKDKVNFIACNKSNFYEKALYYIKNEKERNRITNNGYEFVHKYHTNAVRAKEFIKYITDYLEMKNN
ncbi:glycosyltransferase [Oceanirhabdus sp. W0125-5]|uniref:glycosyltransferase n=1 Tax=Oceanirhabdus sp. W0125-5 TaxID=2999116 RepID=UPI0022F2D486|nr:glycosyltransferase [Oceanirhabdus sp. W0125-5]WBW96618.1 glycosyltransferase [Oceanirhabdus sp. W0125-5]